MKKFLILTAFLVLQISTVFASVEKHIDKQINYEMEYPIVYTKNQAAQNKINQDIYKYIAAFRDDYNAGKFQKGVFKYKVKFEDNNYICLRIADGRFPIDMSGIAHSAINLKVGLVYDKNSGKKVPLSNFLKITLQDLQNLKNKIIYSEGEGAYRAEDGDKVEGFDFKQIPERVSEDYYLLGNGGIALIYQFCEISYPPYGATSIRLSAEEIDWFNRKNRNL